MGRLFGATQLSSENGCRMCGAPLGQAIQAAIRSVLLLWQHAGPLGMRGQQAGPPGLGRCKMLGWAETNAGPSLYYEHAYSCRQMAAFFPACLSCLCFVEVVVDTLRSIKI